MSQAHPPRAGGEIDRWTDRAPGAQGRRGDAQQNTAHQGQQQDR